MKKLLVLPVFLFITLAISPLKAQQEFWQLPLIEQENAGGNSTLANDWFDAKIAGDFSAMGSLMTDDFQIFGVTEKPLDKAGYVEEWQTYHSYNKSMTINQRTVLPIHIEGGEMTGDWVILTGEASWMLRPTEEKIISWFTTFIKVENEKVVLAYHFQDNLPIMLQMGYSLQAPEWAQSTDGE